MASSQCHNYGKATWSQLIKMAVGDFNQLVLQGLKWSGNSQEKLKIFYIWSANYKS